MFCGRNCKVTWGYFDTGDTLTQVAALFTYLLFQHDWSSSSFNSLYGIVGMVSNSDSTLVVAVVYIRRHCLTCVAHYFVRQCAKTFVSSRVQFEV